ncbi:MAG: hypothetical protein O2887_01470 [Bacteroidetes bacterium]|nr:hypothetical protein [Bacteroidota bacterium]MDA1119159.1 hypothetical protein [Bacteroidota bacterium]
MKDIIKIILLILCTGTLFGQNGTRSYGAESMAIGNAAITTDNAWSIFNNPAGLYSTEQPAILFTHQRKYGIGALSTSGAAFLYPFKTGALGIGVSRFGDELYNEQKLNLVFGNKVGMVALGGSLNYYQLNIEGYGNRGIAYFDFGGIVNFSEQFVFGAFISNINQGRISKVENGRVPTIMRSGISYRPVDVFRINIEIEKDLDFPEVFKAGIDYKFYKQFSMRMGFKSNPFIGSLGLGMNSKKIGSSYAFAHDPVLGMIHELSVEYKLAKSR